MSSKSYTVHGIFQVRILEWVAFPFSRGSSQPRDHTQVSCIAGICSTSWVTVQFSCSAVSDSLWPHEPQHFRPPCPSLTPGVHPNPCPLSWWCRPTISSSVIPFSSCPQSFPASGSFQMSQLCASRGQSIGASASASVLPMNIQDLRIFLEDWLVGSPYSPRNSQESSPTPEFKSINSLVLNFLYSPNSHIHTRLLEKPQLWPDGPLLAK